MNPRRIDLHIEELVVEGVRGIRPADLAGSVERELSRRLEAHGLPPSFPVEGAQAEIDAGTIPPPKRGDASGFGAAIARAIHPGDNP